MKLFWFLRKPPRIRPQFSQHGRKLSKKGRGVKVFGGEADRFIKKLEKFWYQNRTRNISKLSEKEISELSCTSL
jgi:hypothetical protein